MAAWGHRGRCLTREEADADWKMMSCRDRRDRRFQGSRIGHVWKTPPTISIIDLINIQ